MQQREYDSWVNKIEDIGQLVEFSQCTNTAYEWKMQYFRVSRFPLQVVQKHKLFEVA